MKNDAVTIAPHLHKIIFENERMRLLEVTVKPGERAEMHSHPENIVYILAPGVMRFTNQNNEPKDVTFKIGDTAYTKATTHAVENIGDTELKAIQMEFKI